jgi:[ribosomal protein S18]-alanine N-acetyltransferase
VGKTAGNIEITPMTGADLPQVLAIERASFPDPWSERMFRDDLKDDGMRLTVCLRSDGKVAGYAVGWFVLDEFHLGNIAVAPGRQGQGLGRKLMEHCVAQAKARQCTIATLEVRASNGTAIGLYRSFGFREVALRKKYYQNEDALVMLAELSL